jgi:hypothetical protein
MSLMSPHRLRAMHLYRHALKTCLDWSGSRQQWYARVRTNSGADSHNSTCYLLFVPVPVLTRRPSHPLLLLLLQSRAIRAEFEANRDIVSTQYTPEHSQIIASVLVLICCALPGLAAGQPRGSRAHAHARRGPSQGLEAPGSNHP